MTEDEARRPSGPLARVLAAAEGAATRHDMLAAIFAALQPRRVAEVGVWRGELAARLLAATPSIEAYHLIDPWRPLENWNKPLNGEADAFEDAFRAAHENVAPFADRVATLRGRTVDVIDRIPDGALDVAYIDGDHTLRGIVIDMLRTFPKLRDGGLMLGDDFSPTIWQHARTYEPTLVFPFAVHFAEAHDLPIMALPHRQFALVKTAPPPGFVFHDTVAAYGDQTLLRQIAQPPPPRSGRLSRPRAALGV